jgi:hypothetical protein
VKKRCGSLFGQVCSSKSSVIILQAHGSFYGALRLSRGVEHPVKTVPGRGDDKM